MIDPQKILAALRAADVSPVEADIDREENSNIAYVEGAFDLTLFAAALATEPAQDVSLRGGLGMAALTETTFGRFLSECTPRVVHMGGKPVTDAETIAAAVEQRQRDSAQPFQQQPGSPGSGGDGQEPAPRIVAALRRMIYLQEGGPLSGVAAAQWLDDAKAALAEFDPAPAAPHEWKVILEPEWKA